MSSFITPLEVPRGPAREHPYRPSRAGGLIDLLQAGGDREDIFRQIFELYRRPIRAFFRRNGFSDEDGRDLTQETFLLVGRSIDGFRGQSRFETWLYEIATNVKQKEIRRRKAIKRDMKEISLDGLTVEPPTVVEVANTSTPASPELHLLDKERRQLMLAEINRMPPQMQRCFRLWSEGCKFLEIAVLMQISLNAVKSHLGQAKARLKSRLGEAAD